MKKTLIVLLSCTLAICTFSQKLCLTSAEEQIQTVDGDVNADGLFSTADIVLLQQWLLQIPGADLADWEAGDLCKDGKLDIFDLCQMRQKLTASANSLTFERLIGMNYIDAVQNNYIFKTEYNCQISGKLKCTIEEKMKRPIDYSKDRFYLIRLDHFDAENDTQYLYNSNTMDVYPITETTKINRAAWYWKGKKAALYGIDNNADVQNEFLDAMEHYGITEIYYSSGANKLVNNKDTVAAFVRNAYARNMKVYLLTGENTWLYEDSYQTAIYRVFDRVEEYNSMVEYDERLAGVSYDAEVWTNSEYDWKNNDAARYQQVKFIEAAQAYADSKNLSASYCLPFWIVRYSYTDSSGTVQNVYDSITQTATETILMAYRDSAAAVEKLVTEVQTNAEQSVYDYIEKNDCGLEIGIQADENSEGDHVTFYEEETEMPGSVNAALAAMQTDLKAHASHTTFAIHQATQLYEFYVAQK